MTPDRPAEATGYEAHLLSNGSYSVLLSPGGGGYSALDGYALTRWVPDAVLDDQGFFFYLRDLDAHRYWSIGRQPAAAEASHGARFAAAHAGLWCEYDGVHARMEVWVAPAANIELRRITVTNHGTRVRRLDLTTYAELALNTPAADAAHPAFSKLFIQTGLIAEHQAVFGCRRLRSPTDRPLYVGSRILQEHPGRVSYETDRARFIGRGRSVRAPRALEECTGLSGTIGNVLDPIISLRCELVVEPGESAACLVLMCAGESREQVVRLLARFDGLASATDEMATALPAPTTAHAALGIPDAWQRGIRISTDQREIEHATRPSNNARRAERVSATAYASEQLRSFNGTGGFSNDGNEYVIRLAPDDDELQLTPLPWINVIANERFGFLISERGAGYSWSENSRENRLTPWSNDPVTDPHGEAIYIRADDTGAVWSPLPGPVPGGGTYEVRHGFGYTQYCYSSDQLDHEVLAFVPRHESVKLVRLRITNRGSSTRALSIFWYAQLILGRIAAETRSQLKTERAVGRRTLFARNPGRGEFAARVAFADVVGSELLEWSATGDRSEFLGAAGDTEHPAALHSRQLGEQFGPGLDPCFALCGRLELTAGESFVCAFLLGEAESEPAARACLEQFKSIEQIDRALTDVRAFWTDLLGRVRIETPIDVFDLGVNGWLAYQTLACRLWARSAFYQSGGAFGFRDQLQDSAALIYLDPTFARQQILLHASHQFVEGDVLHWWHPPSSKGIRTRFSDDLLWLPCITAFYVHSTGDGGILEEDVPFLRARELMPSEDEAFLLPQPAGESASLWEHCCRAIDRSLTRGAHGLPLIGTGDWNDGMNRVGREGRGESVWLGFFLFDILDDFVPLAEQRGDRARAARYHAYQRELLGALDREGWDGAWYRRAYYDNGKPLGSAQNDECRIDAIAQAWAVLSGAVPPERAKKALDALEAHLVSERDGIIRLLTPAFDRTPEDPGYIKGYLPGIRENGGQYTHGALWSVRALAEAGRTERAARLLQMLSPVEHARTPEQVRTYQVEPYVIAADVYGVAPHTGRGGWTWYTGSAGWMYRVVLESILGFELRDGKHISLRPCIPADWPGFRIDYRAPTGDSYAINVSRSPGGPRATLDGHALETNDRGWLIPLSRDGRAHQVRVELGVTSDV